MITTWSNNSSSNIIKTDNTNHNSEEEKITLLLTYGTLESLEFVDHSSNHSNHTSSTLTCTKTTASAETATGITMAMKEISPTSSSSRKAKAQSVEVEIDDEERFWLNIERDEDNDEEEEDTMQINPESTTATTRNINANTSDGNSGSGSGNGTYTNTTATTATSTTTKKAATLKLSSLAILVFYNVSGGPFGIEPTIRSSGNLFAILGFIIGPIVWSIPEAFITAELGSTFRYDASGGVSWVDEAFGTKWGMVCGFFSWISGATDNAIYPTLFLQYLISVMRHQSSSSTMTNDYYDYGDNTVDLTTATATATSMWYDNNFALFAFVSILSILLSLLNYRGLEIVGNASIVVCIIAMSPFVIMTVLGMPKIDPSRWFILPDADSAAAYYDDNSSNATKYYDSSNNSNNEYDEDGYLQFSSWLQTLKDAIDGGGILWTPYLNNLFWNLNSFDAAASFAGEVHSPSKTYPNGIFWGLFLSIIFYLIPLLVVTGATNYKQNEWVDGQLGKAAIDIGGNWLGAWIIFAAGISNLALFEAELSSDSYQLMGMAQRGHLPKVFARRSEQYGTPTVGILTCTLVIIALSVADFMQLVELLNFNYAIALLMEYAAFVKLRLTRKDLQRPYRIPIPDWAAILIIIPPCLGILVLFRIASWITYVFVLLAFLLGLVCNYMQQLAKRKGLCAFVEPGSFEDSHTSPERNDDPYNYEYL